MLKAALTFCSLLAFALTAQSQVVLSSFTYSEDFDTLVNTGTSSTLPNGWTFLETGTNANTSYSAGTGSSTTGDTWSFGALAATDRALGSLRSGTLISTFGVAFTNNTGEVINALLISYFGEQWRLGTTGRNDRLDFQISFDATSLATGTWMDVDSLDFIAPVGTGAAGALDGNTNRVEVTNTLTALSIANGQTFWIRWTDFDATGSDDGLGIDNFNLTVIPEPATYMLFGIGLLACAQRFRRAKNK